MNLKNLKKKIEKFKETKVEEIGKLKEKLYKLEKERKHINQNQFLQGK